MWKAISVVLIIILLGLIIYMAIRFMTFYLTLLGPTGVKLRTEFRNSISELRNTKLSQWADAKFVGFWLAAIFLVAATALAIVIIPICIVFIFGAYQLILNKP